MYTKIINGNAFKIFNDSGKKMCNEESLISLVGTQNSTYVFPQKLIYIDGILSGYSMEYINGKNIYDALREVDIPTLKQAINIAENGIKNASELRIMSIDLNQGGILWDNQSQTIRIIDTDFYIKANEQSPEECYQHNINDLITILQMELGIINGQMSDLICYLQKNNEYVQFDMHATIASLMVENPPSLIEYIDKIVSIFEKDFGFVPKNFAEIYRSIIERTGNIQTVQQKIPTFTPPEFNAGEER